MTKLGIYALCKDQEDQVDGFMDMVEGVDHVLIVDLGSKDDSVLRLRSRGARVIELRMRSERADLNRTAALEALPEGLDVCMCLELYQRIDHGWVDQIKNSWVQGCTRMTYWIHEGKHKYLGDWIHAREGYAWRYPIHEELIPTAPENEYHCEIHLRQERKRILNIDLLKTAIDENMHIGYLRMKAAEDILMSDPFSAKDDVIYYVEDALNCEDLTQSERAFTCFLGSLYCQSKFDHNSEELWLMRAVIEETGCREWWYHLAKLLQQRSHSQRALVAINHATNLDDEPHKIHNTVEPWGPELYILAAKCATDCEERALADSFYMRGTRLFTDSIELAKLYGEFLS